jgi:hypothetical protein
MSTWCCAVDGRNLWRRLPPSRRRGLREQLTRVCRKRPMFTRSRFIRITLMCSYRQHQGRLSQQQPRRELPPACDGDADIWSISTSEEPAIVYAGVSPRISQRRRRRHWRKMADRLPDRVMWRSRVGSCGSPSIPTLRRHLRRSRPMARCAPQRRRELRTHGRSDPLLRGAYTAADRQPDRDRGMLTASARISAAAPGTVFWPTA